MLNEGIMIKTQKGTRDILFPEILNWQNMEEKALKIFGSANFEEIFPESDQLVSWRDSAG